MLHWLLQNSTFIPCCAVTQTFLIKQNRFPLKTSEMCVYCLYSRPVSSRIRGNMLTPFTSDGCLHIWWSSCGHEKWPASPAEPHLNDKQSNNPECVPSYSKHSNCLHQHKHSRSSWGTQQRWSPGFLTTHSVQNGSTATLICWCKLADF